MVVVVVVACQMGCDIYMPSAGAADGGGGGGGGGDASAFFFFSSVFGCLLEFLLGVADAWPCARGCVSKCTTTTTTTTTNTQTTNQNNNHNNNTFILPQVSLDDSVCLDVLARNANLKATTESLWFYEPLNMKSRARWLGISTNRSVLLDLLQASHGHMFRQCQLEKQVATFLAAHKFEAKPTDAGKIAYRLRCQLSHLRDARSAGRKPPQQYDHLRALMDCISLSAPASQGLDTGADPKTEAGAIMQLLVQVQMSI